MNQDKDKYTNFEEDLPSYVEQLVGHIIILDIASLQKYCGGCSKWCFEQIHDASKWKWREMVLEQMGILIEFSPLTTDNAIAWANLSKGQKRRFKVIETQVREMFGEKRVNGNIIE